MAWSMPPAAAPWNAGMANMPMAPDMGNYSQEQWAAMQQQNWQQWTQWQQQYAQWQSQYGEKYAQQMQVMQMQPMGGMPPLPMTAAAPAPPPPENPPPPPPHENNQPLYGGQKPAVVAPQQPNQTQAYNNVAATTQNWSYTSVANQQATQQTSQQATQQASQPDPAVVNAEALKKLAEEERLFDIQFQKWEEEIQKWKKENANHPDKEAYKEYETKFEACRVQLLERRQQMKQRRARLLGQTATNNVAPTVPPLTQPSVQPPTILQNDSSNQNSVQNSEKTSFLPASGSSAGIPGLDLVPDTGKPANSVDAADDKSQTAPDYTKISKGINNILGDEKIMNILSMVRGQNDANAVGSAGAQGATPAQVAQAGVVAQPTQTSIVAPPQVAAPPQTYMAPPPQTNYYPYGMDYSSYSSYYNAYAGQAYASSNYTMPTNYQWDASGQYNNQQANMQTSQYNQYYDANNYGANMGAVPLMGKPMMPPGQQNMNNNMQERGQQENRMNQRPTWVEDPILTPSIIVEYDHKPLRLKAREFIEPVQTIDYNHKSKEEEPKKIKDFEREIDDLFSRKPRRFDNDFGNSDRFARELNSDFDRRPTKNDIERDGSYSRVPPRDFPPRDVPPRDLPSREIPRDYPPRDNPTIPPRDYPPRDEFKWRGNDAPFDKRFDDRDKFPRNNTFENRDRDDFRERERHDFRMDNRGLDGDRNRLPRRDETRSKSRDKDSRKRGRSKETEISAASKKSKEEAKQKPVETPKPVVLIDDILETPGREMRPDKIVIILRGPPGSGKSHLAKLIRDREAEYGGAARIMSIDDYFMQEGEVEEKDPSTGKIVRKPTLKYEFDEKSEETYLNSLKRAFKRSLTDGYFNFLIYDAINDQLKSYADIWNFARQNGFQVYVCTLELDPIICHNRNIHNRSLEDIQVICSRFFPTPAHHIQLDPTTLLQTAAMPPDVQMEETNHQVIMEQPPPPITEVEVSFTSKWEKMDDAVQLARLDGTSKPLRSSQLSMEGYLQLDDWTPNQAKPGKKTVRWADIEERRQQEKMRAIGFVVGQTDWNRMTDPTMGSSALTQTKFIERVKRKNFY